MDETFGPESEREKALDLRDWGSQAWPIRPKGTPKANALSLDELNPTTRLIMVNEFDSERCVSYSSICGALSSLGVAAFPALMRAVLGSGTVNSLARALAIPQYWLGEKVLLHGVHGEIQVDVEEAALRCAVNEFNSWYVRALSRRLISEGAGRCEVYSAANVPCETGACTFREGDLFPPEEIYHGSRSRLRDGDRGGGVHVPAHDSCYHTVRRRRG